MTSVLKTVESGVMSKDLAMLAGKQQPYLNTQDFLSKIDDTRKAAMS